MRCFSIVLLLVTLASPLAGFAQDEPARIVIESVKLPQQGSAQINRYGLTRSDFDSIIKQVPGIEWSVTIRRTESEARYASKAASVELLGTTENYAKMLKVKQLRGRFLVAKDIEQRNNVAVIGEKVANRLFSGSDPIGKNIRIGIDYYLIVGIVGAGARREEFESEPVPIRSETRINFDQTDITFVEFSRVEALENSIFIPISTMQARIGDDAIILSQGSFEVSSFQISRIELVLEDPRRKLETARLIDQILKQSHPEADYRIHIPR